MIEIQYKSLTFHMSYYGNQASQFHLLSMVYDSEVAVGGDGGSGGGGLRRVDCGLSQVQGQRELQNR